MLNLYDGKILRELVFGVKPDTFIPPKKVYYKVCDTIYTYEAEIVAGYYDEDKGKYYGISCSGRLVPNPLELVNWDFDYFCIYLKEHYPEEFTISDSEVLNKNKVLIANRGKKGPRSSTNQKMYVEIPWDSLSPEVIENEVKGWIDMKLEEVRDFDYFCKYLKECYSEEFTISDDGVFNKNGVLIATCNAKGGLRHFINSILYEDISWNKASLAAIQLAIPKWIEMKPVFNFESLKLYLRNNYPNDFKMTENAIFNNKGVLITEASLDHTIALNNCASLSYSSVTSLKSIDSFAESWKKGENVRPKVLANKSDIDKDEETEPEEEMKPQNENLWTDRKQCTVENLLIIESSCKLNAYWVQYETERFIRDQRVDWDGFDIDRLKRELASQESKLDKNWTTDTGYLRITGIAKIRENI